MYMGLGVPLGLVHIEVYAIRFALCHRRHLSDGSMEVAESRLWRRAKCIVYNEYRIVYTSM